MTLNEIEKGGAFKICGLTGEGEIKKRLLDMGFIRGAIGKILREAPLRDPIELQLNNENYRLSLRRSEAATIVVERIECAKNAVKQNYPDRYSW